MNKQRQLVLITPTWAGDIDHFRLMRASLEQSPLAQFEHYVVVQDEDLALFDEFRNRDHLTLLSTKNVLPDIIERRRRRARYLSGTFGRTATRICGSLKRIFSRPLWPSYTGWHTQQLCKLKLASELPYDTAVVIDSDVIVTQSASIDDFINHSNIVCFSEWLERSQLRGKVKNWVHESEALVSFHDAQPNVNVYFDTPFGINCSLLQEALNELESSTGTQWWNALLNRPPRRWSEFGFYKAFLAKKASTMSIEWRKPSFSRYLYDTKNPEAVVNTVAKMLKDPDIHYVTIHSQANGREHQDPNIYLKPILSLISEHR